MPLKKRQGRTAWAPPASPFPPEGTCRRLRGERCASGRRPEGGARHLPHHPRVGLRLAEGSGAAEGVPPRRRRGRAGRARVPAGGRPALPCPPPRCLPREDGGRAPPPPPPAAGGSSPLAPGLREVPSWEVRSWRRWVWGERAAGPSAGRLLPPSRRPLEGTPLRVSRLGLPLS